MHLEIGCGKGQFLAAMSQLHPEIGYLGMETQREVCYYAVKKLRGRNPQCPDHPRRCGPSAGVVRTREVDQIFLNFSDPWPKARHAKRRLTYRTFLAEYKKILKPGGHLRFKTDNDDLFAFSVEEFKEFGLKILALTTDLHHTDILNEAQTEYEQKFSTRGKNINFCEVQF